MSQWRVLLVDDSADTIELVRESLAGEFDFCALEDPERFFDYLEVAEPDVVLLDLLMPKVDGFAILSELQARPALAARLPIVVLSAKRSVEDQKRAYGLGAKLYLTKPFEPDRLRRNLSIFIESAHLPERPKMFKVSELDRQLKLRASFKESQLGQVPSGGQAPEGTVRSGGRGYRPPGLGSALSHLEEDETSPEPRWVD